MQIVSVTITENKKVSFDYYKLSFCAKELEKPVAGQFLTIQLPLTHNQILRKPFAYSDFYKKNGLFYGSIIYQLRGEGTTYLSSLQCGDKLSILGPLGNGFPSPIINSQSSNCPTPQSMPCFSNYKQVYCISGGVGLAPMIFTYNQLKNTEKKYGYKTTLVAGFKTHQHIPKCDKIATVAHLCCDDGSRGYKGTVVDYLKTIPLSRLKESLFFGCGPLPMMKSLYNFCKEGEFPLFLSLEEMMGCAVGACMGCITETHTESGYQRVCKDGPIFNATLLKWD